MAEVGDSIDQVVTEVRTFDATGKEVASATLPGGVSLMYGPLVAEVGGAFLVSGSVRDSAQLAPGMTGATGDSFLMQLDASFQQRWYRTFPGAGVGVVAAFPDGGFMLSGGGTPGVDFGAGPVTDAPSAHYTFVARYDSSGGLVWQREWASAWGAAVVVAGDGSVFASGGGVADSAVAGLSGVSNSWIRAANPILLKLGADGAYAWAEAVPPGSDILICTVDSTGHVIAISFSGISSSTGGESVVKFAR